MFVGFGSCVFDRDRQYDTSEQVNGHWQIQYPLAVFAWEVNESNQ